MRLVCFLYFSNSKNNRLCLVHVKWKIRFKRPLVLSRLRITMFRICCKAHSSTDAAGSAFSSLVNRCFTLNWKLEYSAINLEKRVVIFSNVKSESMGNKWFNQMKNLVNQYKNLLLLDILFKLFVSPPYEYSNIN